MKFTYIAPVEYNDLTSGFRTIESEYTGPHDFKVYVDVNTRRIEHGVEFDHDGHPEIHGGTDSFAHRDDVEMIYLHSHNPNHIALMAMICNHEDHTAENQVEVVCEKYNMVYQRHEPPTLDHTYDRRLITIDSRGVVTYPWWQMDITWDMLVTQGKSHRNTIAERLRTDILTQEQRDKANYCIEIIDYVLLNGVSQKHPWKVAWPDIHSVTLDNSIPIGIPDGIPNGPREMSRTEMWGAVPHDPACHYEGDHIVLDAICPTTPEEAAQLEPWVDLHEDHPTHSTQVALHLEARESLHASVEPHVELTNDHVLEHMDMLIAAKAAAAPNPDPQ